MILYFPQIQTGLAIVIGKLTEGSNENAGLKGTFSNL